MLFIQCIQSSLRKYVITPEISGSIVSLHTNVKLYAMNQDNTNMYMDLHWEHLDIAEHRCHCQHRLIKADKKINKPQAVIVIDNAMACL